MEGNDALISGEYRFGAATKAPIPTTNQMSTVFQVEK